MNLQEKFDLMVANGSFKHEGLRTTIKGLIMIDPEMQKKRVGSAEYLIIAISKAFPESQDDVLKLVSPQHKVNNKSEKLVTKEVSQVSNGNTESDSECPSCDNESDNSIDLSEAKTYKQVLKYFKSNEEKIDEYIKAMSIKTRANTIEGKAKEILEHVAI